MDLFVLFQKTIPQTLLTVLAGSLASSERKWLKNKLIKKFIKAFVVDMKEAQFERPEQYRSFNEFFTRPLKAGCRPLDVGAGNEQQVFSPADGVISEIGELSDDRILQAKGMSYTLKNLIGDSDLAESCRGGTFVTIYLSPKDYHRIHVPFEATLESIDYKPGKLFSVNQRTANNVHGLFARNERLVATLDANISGYALVMVGAMIVGGMETRATGKLNRSKHPYSPKITAQKFAAGEEFGRFYLGSTVILTFPRQMNIRWDEKFRAGAPVKMGQSLGWLEK
ncbi:MAG: phosphatidylserine decarboxylase [Parasphingorhabdus sp.]